MRTVTVTIDEEIDEVRACQCGCGTSFIVRRTSKRAYFSRKHKTLARDARRAAKPKPLAEPDPVPPLKGEALPSEA